ncbi:integrase, catalytic region, zinc finger, CCHC-type containing protein [Tanacetum coccineum]
MSNTNMQTQTSNALHNAIMEAGGKDHPLMLASGYYVQWKSRIKRYIDTKPNNELIHYCLQNPPYKFKWTEKTDQLNAEAEAKAIERLKQGESINVQDLETNLYWEFGKFTSRDGESLESYYSRFYKMMNELVRNQCDVTNHQVNVQFLLQLQPEWQRFVTLVKQSQELKTVSYHKLYDILKQHQNEVNEIRAERLARTANPLALVAQQQPAYHPQNHPNHHTQNSSTRSQQATRNRGKAIVNSSAPIYDQEPATVTEDDEMSKEKEIDKLMALISLSFKKIYKPTNNNLRTSSNTSRLNPDNSLRINRGTEISKPTRHKVTTTGPQHHSTDAGYHKEKMLLCKQEEAVVQLNAEQADWKDDNDDESDDQELEAHYMYIAQIQEVTPDIADISGPIFDVEPLQKLLEIILFIFNSGCSKHMTGNLKLLTNFVDKFLRMVKFGNDQIAPILGYGDLVQGTITIKTSTCYIRDLKGNDLLTGSRGTDLYSITLQDTSTPNPICLMAKATSSQAWLWHRRLSHLNFDTINLLSKNNIVTGLPKLKFVKDNLYSSCELGKPKENLEVAFRKSTCYIRDLKVNDLLTGSRGTNLYSITLQDTSTPNPICLMAKATSSQAWLWHQGIRHETSTARTPEQNGVIERRNRTLVEAARTMLSADKVPLFFWAEAIATHVLLKTVHSDGENLDKMKEKGDACIFVGYSTQSRAYRSFAVHVADAPDKHQHHNTTHSSTTTVVADAPPLNIQTTPQTTNQAPTQVQYLLPL